MMMIREASFWAQVIVAGWLAGRETKANCTHFSRHDGLGRGREGERKSCLLPSLGFLSRRNSPGSAPHPTAGSQADQTSPPSISGFSLLPASSGVEIFNNLAANTLTLRATVSLVCVFIFHFGSTPPLG